MKKNLRSMFLLVFCLLLISCSSQDSRQNINTEDFGNFFVEKKGGFSMYAPKGWREANVNMKYKMLIGPREGDFSSSIGFTDEEYTGSVSDYVKAVIPALLNGLSDSKLIERVDFVTSNEIYGECITLQGRLQTVSSRQKIYVIPNNKGTSIMLITCSVPQSVGTKYDDIFDDCVETFRWKK
jgi:hypothetical protein